LRLFNGGSNAGLYIQKWVYNQLGVMHLKGILSVIGILSIFMSYGQAQNSHLRWVALPDSLIQVNSFGEGLAKVQTSTGRIGYIDSSGNYIIRLNKSFVDAGNFQDGYAWVYRKSADSKQYGFMDKKGNIRISCQYDKVENFSNGLALVHTEAVGWQLIDSTGSVLLGDTSLLVKEPVYQGDKLVEWQEVEPPASQDGRMLTFKAGKYGYLNSQGQPVIACRFLKATGYANGVALAAVDSVKDQFAKMDTTRDLLDDLYDNLEPGPPEYIWTLIDSNGQQIRTFNPGWTLDVTRGFSQRLLPFKNEQGFWGFINTHGQVTIPAKFRQEPSPFSDGVCFLSVRGQSADNKDGYMLVIDTAGEKIAKIPF